jgi:hypothetical protein
MSVEAINFCKEIQSFVNKNKIMCVLAMSLATAIYSFGKLKGWVVSWIQVCRGTTKKTAEIGFQTIKQNEFLNKNSSNIVAVQDLKSRIPELSKKEANQQLTVSDLSKEFQPLLSDGSAYEILSIRHLSFLFNANIENMQMTTDPKKYGEYLRAAEIICLKLQRDPTFDQVQMEKIKAEFEIAFQNQPEGSSQLLQRDIDQIKRLDKVPYGIICQNKNGENFLKPEISIMQLRSILGDLNYNSIMYGREAIGFNDNEISEVSDILMVPKKLTSGFLPKWRGDWSFGFSSEEELLNRELTILSDHLAAKVKTMGYAGFVTGLIKNLKDKDYANRLINQGFDIYCVFIYPKKLR